MLGLERRRFCRFQGLSSSTHFWADTRSLLFPFCSTSWLVQKLVPNLCLAFNFCGSVVYLFDLNLPIIVIICHSSKSAADAGYTIMFGYKFHRRENEDISKFSLHPLFNANMCSID